jgi:hypothetical protein
MSPSSEKPWDNETLIGRGIAFRGESLPVSDRPYEPDPDLFPILNRSVEAVWRASEAVTEAFVKDRGIRSLFGYGALQTECILKDPGYRPAIPLGRLDSYLTPEGPVFMEFNTDGTAAWHYTAALTALWRETMAMPPERLPLHERLFQILLYCFRKWDRRDVDTPRIAIVDWAEVGTRPEQEALAAYFTRRGFPATLEDPRALRLESGHLVGSEGPIHLVYRRVVSEEAFARQGEIQPFLDGYLNDAACYVGGFRTDPAWSKTLFVVLSDPAFRCLLPEDVAPILDRCIPWTRRLLRGTTSWRGRDMDLEGLLRSNPEGFVIKPARGYEGRGVCAGALVPFEAWEKALETGLEMGGQIVQEFVPPVEATGPDGSTVYQQLGEFVLLGRLAGLLARTTTTPVIQTGVVETYHPVGLEIPLGGS